jgi:uncharacterized repeat protein (TIGR01451 family)
MAERGRRQTPSLLFAVCLTGLAGCVGPARGPDPLVGPPTAAAPAPVSQTDAKPPTPRLFAAIDPRAARLDVRPTDAVLATHAEQVLIASVVDAAGRPLPGRRVEWTLDGPGAIVAVDDLGRLLERGRKVDNYSAVSFTEHFEHVVNQSGVASFTIGRGQSWCIVASADEGLARVTATAPEIGAPNPNRVVVTQHWAGADWTPPTPSTGAPGATQFLSANVFRRASRWGDPSAPSPADYSVRYRILDGPPAQFLPSQGVETVVAASASGVAPAVLAQPAAQTGRNRIGVELLNKNGEVVGRSETYADWQGPDLSFSAAFLPTATVGQEAPLTLGVSNGGVVASGPLTVRVSIPDGCKYVRSDPPATPEGDELVWALPSAPGHDRRTLQAVFQTERVGPLTARASLTTADGRRDEKTALCDVTPRPAPQLKVWPTGPETGLVGAKIVYQVKVQNEGKEPAANVVLKAALSDGLEYENGGANVETAVGTLAAGESRTVALPVRLTRAGAAATKVTAVGDGGLAASAERPLQVRDARLTLRLSGPARGYVGKPAVWELEVRNIGETPVTQTTVSDLLSPELVFIEATDGGRLQGREVLWRIGDLPPGGVKLLHLTTTTAKPTPRTTNTATAAARVGGDASAEVRVQANADLAVLGLSAYRMTLEGRDDSVAVGGRTAYRVQVRNIGSLPGERVQLSAAIPPEMRLITAYGPTTYQVNGERVTFLPMAALQPGQTLTYMVEVQAMKQGVARFRAELTTDTMREPVVKEENTNVR